MKISKALTLPNDLVARGRWLLLLLALFHAGVLAPLFALTSTLAWPLRLLALAALAALCSGWIRGYLRGGFARSWEIAEGLAILWIGLTAEDPQTVPGMMFLSLMYAGLCFRSFSASARRLPVVVLVFVGAYFGAIVLSQTVTSRTFFSPLMLIQASGLAMSAGLMHILHRFMIRHERVLARERILARSGSALAAASRASMYATVCDAALALLDKTPEASVRLVLGTAGSMAIVATGERTVRPAHAGWSDQALTSTPGSGSGHELPAAVNLSFPEQRLVDARGDHLLGIQAALGVFPEMKAILVTPLIAAAELKGMIVVATASTLPQDCRDGLRALSVPVALALTNVSLVEALRQNEARFRSLVQNACDVMTIVEADFTIRYQTPSVEPVFGYRAEELVGTRLTEVLHPDDVRLAVAFLADATRQAGITAPVQWRLRRPDGSWLAVETMARNLLHDANVRGVVLNTRDVSMHKALEAQLRHRAFHDALTSLANRDRFTDHVQNALARADRRNMPLAVLFMDLDDFKVINDSLGHAIGDRLLVMVAERLRTCLRDGDSAARLGGDEFAILLESLEEPGDAVLVVDRIAASLRAPFALEEKEVLVTGSIGIAVSTAGRETSDELLRNADVAMYVAKNHARGSYVIFEPGMHTRALERLELGADLQRAVERQEFSIHYQPIVVLGTARIAGVEALVRWAHEDRGLVFPADFISLAEETGMILPIGRKVLQEACVQAREWQMQYPSDPLLTLTINLSARQVQDPGLGAEVARALQESQLDPQSLILEITESVLMSATQLTIATLKELKALGVQLAIDDYGAGCSSLSSLRDFPIDILKIDKSLVDGVTHEPAESGPAEKELVCAIINLGATLRLQTVAKGIERVEQVSQLCALGCDLGQGYYFAPPRGKEATSSVLRRANRGEAWLAGQQPGLAVLPFSPARTDQSVEFTGSANDGPGFRRHRVGEAGAPPEAHHVQALRDGDNPVDLTSHTALDGRAASRHLWLVGQPVSDEAEPEQQPGAAIVSDSGA